MARTHASAISDFNVFVAGNRFMTSLIQQSFRETKHGIFDIIRCYHEFINVRIITFAFGEDEFSASEDGHWLIFAIDMAEDRIYCFDSFNAFKGAQTAFEKLVSCFIEPYLSYKQEYDGPIDKKRDGTFDAKFYGEIKKTAEAEARAARFKLVTVQLPETQQDGYSCGFWAVKILLDIAVRRIHPREIKTRLGDPEEYRLVVSKILRSRYLYYGGYYEKPRKEEC